MKSFSKFDSDCFNGQRKSWVHLNLAESVSGEYQMDEGNAKSPLE